MYGERKYVADLHVIVDLELFGDDVRSVELFVNDAAADRVTVKTDQHVKERCAVKDNQFLVAVFGA